MDLLFPRSCVFCKNSKEECWLCSECASKIKLLENQVCPECRRPSAEGKYHSSCSQNNQLSGILIACEGEQEIIREAVHKFKYTFLSELNDVLGNLLAQAIRQNLPNFRDYILIPVPLHRSRLRWRGFNQAEKLALEVGQKLEIKIRSDILIRSRRTESQMKLNREERLKNLIDAFSLIDSTSSIPPKIILVDDIVTTGATLTECAKVLRLGGAKEIFGLVISRGT